jgi:hypothetical protein
LINYLNDEINSIDCNLGSKYDKNYKVLYFKETGEFMLISKTYLTTTLFNEIKMLQDVEKIFYQNKITIIL